MHKSSLQELCIPLVSWRLALILIIVKFHCFFLFHLTRPEGCAYIQNILRYFPCPKSKNPAIVIINNKEYKYALNN